MEYKERYARQIMLPEIGESGQKRMADASVLIVGVGGLGSPAALYLTAAGVGRIGLADADRVSESNLQRQVLYTEADLGASKVEAAAKRLRALSSHTRFDLYDEELTRTNGATLIARYDIVVECSDNYATRYLVDEICHALGKPWVYGSIGAFAGQVSLFTPESQTRYADLYPDRGELESMPRASGGVIGPVPGVIGAIEATEAIKWLTGCGTTLAGRLFTIDLSTMQSDTFDL